MATRSFTNAIFCPWCGTETLERDQYRKEHGSKKNGRPSFEFQCPEYFCRLCGRGFRFQPSLRHMHATQLFKEHRKMRPPEDQTEPEKKSFLSEWEPIIKGTRL